MVVLQLKDPLELFVKRREFLPGSGFLPHCDMTKAVESDVKTPIPSFHKDDHPDSWCQPFRACIPSSPCVQWFISPTERPLGTICEGKGISSRFEGFCLRHDLRCWKQPKKHSFLKDDHRDPWCQPFRACILSSPCVQWFISPGTRPLELSSNQQHTQIGDASCLDDLYHYQFHFTPHCSQSNTTILVMEA